jgi:hypothetical protein
MDLQPSGGARRPLSFIPGCNTDPDISRAQLAANAARDLPWLEVQPAHSRRLAIIAGGPSLESRVDELRYFSGDVLALNNAYGFLLDRDITPDMFMLMDARRENVDFLRSCPTVRHYIAAQCHPDVFERLEGLDVCLYLTTLPGVRELLREYKKEKVQLGGTAGTVGIKALALAFALGYRDIHLFGYDSSYDAGRHHAFPQPLNDGANTIEVFIGDKSYTTTPALAHQATEFVGFAKELVMFNGMQIELHCSGLLPDFVAMANAAGEVPLEQREQAKYEEVWTHDAYRKDAPGEHFVSDAIASLGMALGDSVNDYGCGTGRASAKFIALGYALTAVDFAVNALEHDVPFVKACLWDLPDNLESDWAYCTDVMEHIPIEKVEAVISGISSRTLKGAYFNIATRPDNLGALIGRKLHMTVMQGSGWRAFLSKYFARVEMIERDGEATFVCHVKLPSPEISHER